MSTLFTSVLESLSCLPFVASVVYPFQSLSCLLFAKSQLLASVLESLSCLLFVAVYKLESLNCLL